MRLTLQQVFDNAWNAFIVRKEGSALEGYGCRYLTSDGRKCAIGHSLPNGHPATQTQASIIVLLTRPDINDLFDIKDEDGLWTLQRLHDDYAEEDGQWKVSFDDLKAKFRGFAKVYNLEVPNG